MAIRQTHLHLKRAIDQIERNLVGLQRDLRDNAAKHKAMAQSQSPNLATLQSFIADCLTQYNRRLGWLVAIRQHPQWPAVRAAYVAMGGTEADVVDVYTDIKAAVDALAVADVSSYAAIITACDAVLATVDAPLSLWPE